MVVVTVNIEQIFQGQVKEINLKSSQVINCPISNANIANTQVTGPESARKYDTDEVLDLSMKVPITKALPASQYNPDKVIDLSMKAPSQAAPPATQKPSISIFTTRQHTITWVTIRPTIYIYTYIF